MTRMMDEQALTTAQLWPQAVQDKPVKDAFPARSLLLWLIPGAIGVVMLALLLGWLSAQAARNIVYLSPESVSLSAVRADQATTTSLSRTEGRLLGSGGSESLPAPVLGIPQWSPDGRYLAATLNRGRQIAIFPANLLTPTLVTASEVNMMWLAATSDGWSGNGRYLAVVGQEEAQMDLLVYNTQTRQFLPNPQPVDARAGIDWSPTKEELLFTGYGADSSVPNLSIMDSGGNITPFAPEDGQQMRADGAWSPDGKQIAYIASNTFDASQDMLVGGLWIASAAGANSPQRLVAEGAIAPFWDSRGEYIYFTRFLRQTGRFELQRVQADANEVDVEVIGPGTENTIRYPFDRNILFQWSPNRRQLLFQGQGQLPPPAHIPLPSATQEQFHAVLPVKGIGLWSPDGRQFINTYMDESRVRVRVTNVNGGNLTTPDSTDLFVMPADGWSSDSAYAALLRYDGAGIGLAVWDVNDSLVYNAGFTVDAGAGLSWHPNDEEVMVTSADSGITVSLKVFDVAENTSRLFTPQDNQLFHADGAWSPDGRQVAYIARNTLTHTRELDFHTGAIWIADSSGRSARQVVADGLNFAPLWDMDNHRLLFTRYLTETDSFDLYQVGLNGGEPQRLGASLSEFAQFPFDRQLWHDWTPDGRRWMLLSGAEVPESLRLYRAGRDGLDMPLPAALSTECESPVPYVARWAPTGRALLVACPLQEMRLYWLDTETVTPFPTGEFPTWQP